MEVIVTFDFVDDARNVREEVFMGEQGFSYDYDEMDDISAHFVALEDGLPVGACRVFESEDPGVFILGRLAVKKEYRSRGIGGGLVEKAKEYVAEVGGKRLILHSQIQAKGFYTRLGFVEYGEIEYEEDCPHIWMKTEI